MKKIEKSTCKNIGKCDIIIEHVAVRSVGQAVKTPPSHGGNRGSIPLQTVII